MNPACPMAAAYGLLALMVLLSVPAAGAAGPATGERPRAGEQRKWVRYPLAEADGIKVTLAVLRHATAVDVEWMRLEFVNTGGPVRIGNGNYRGDGLGFRVALDSP